MSEMDDFESDKSLLAELEEDLDDVGEIKRRFMPKIIADDEEFNSSQVPVDTINRRDVQNMLENLPKPNVQKPFQPGSSPGDEEKRFLCWNDAGIMRAVYSKDDQSIDVMFHDTEKNASINFKNDANYTLGSMSEDLILVATNGKYGTGPSLIHGINLLEASRDQREWEIEMPHVELIECLAVGKEFAVVFTDNRNLRFFTTSGMQSYILSLAGPVVSMVASGRQLMVVSHRGSGLNDEQNLVMATYYVDLLNNEIKLVLNNIPVALSKRTPLAWIGLTDEGTPCTYDYGGMLRIYRHDLGKAWIPMLDLRELTTSALDHFYVVGVSEMAQAVRAVKCKQSRYPEFTADTSEAYSFSLPMCSMDTDKGKLEEELVRLRLAEASYRRLSSQAKSLNGTKLVAVDSAREANEKLIVNTVLRLFAMYLKDDKEEAAKSLVYVIPFDYMSKLPEFAWKTKRRQYFIDSLNSAIDEREQIELEMGPNKKIATLIDDDDDDDVILKPIGIEKLCHSSLMESTSTSKSTTPTNNNNNNKQNGTTRLGSLTNIEESPTSKMLQGTTTTTTTTTANDSEDEENIVKPTSKRIKSVNYNLFSKKRAKMTN